MVTDEFSAGSVPWRCHRQLLADALTVRGDRLVYDGGQLALARSDRP